MFIPVFRSCKSVTNENFYFVIFSVLQINKVVKFTDSIAGSGTGTLQDDMSEFNIIIP